MGLRSTRHWQKLLCFSHEGHTLNLNKWWDGYSGEDVVIIDDFGPNPGVPHELLKHWTDKYP